MEARLRLETENQRQVWSPGKTYIPDFLLTGVDSWTRPGFCSLIGSSVIAPDLCRLSEFYAVAVLMCIELMWHLKDFP